MALKALEKKLSESNSKIINFFSAVGEAFKKNVLLIQGLTGIMFTGMILKIVLNLTSGHYDMPWQLGGWTTFAGAIYIILIYAEAWKERLRLKNDTTDNAKEHLSAFYSKFNEWTFKITEGLAVDDALEVFKKSVVIFNVMVTGTLEEKLSRMIMIMNDVAFNTKEATKPKEVGNEVDGPAPKPRESNIDPLTPDPRV